MALEDDFEKRVDSIDALREKVDTAPRSEDIEISDFFGDRFIQKSTDFNSFNEMVHASPSEADSAANLDFVSVGTWDEFVQEHTIFTDEEEFIVEARDQWVADQLDLQTE